MRDVLKNLIDGLTDAWIKVGKYWRVLTGDCASRERQGRSLLRASTIRGSARVNRVPVAQYYSLSTITVGKIA
jgi:hypothetical protein